MRLDCAVVKDLYVLYKEGELSEEVKNALENHLQECQGCCNIYETGRGFKDLLHNMEEEEPSKKMDEKIMLTLKIRSLQIFMLFILAIFAVTSIQGYYNSRSHLQSDLAHVEQSLWSMHIGMGNVKNEAYNLSPVGMLLEAINDRNNIINRNLSTAEKRFLRDNNGELFLHTRLHTLLGMLNQRYLAQTWSERDEVVLAQLTHYFSEAVEFLTDERLTLNNLHSNKLLYIRYRVNIGKLADIYRDLNLLAITYINYDKLPGEITLLEEEKLEALVISLFPGAEIVKINGREKAEIWGEVTFELETNENHYNGQLDAFTGNLIMVNSRAIHSGQLLPVGSVETNLTEFLTKLYGQGYTYQTEYLGINYNFSSNVDVKLYTWKVYPFFQGYRLNNTMFLRFDARTGNLYMYDTEGGPVPEIKPGLNINIIMDQDDALSNVKLPEGTAADLSYTETVLIHSRLTGKIQPAHLFSSDSLRIYVNAVLGKQDYPL